MKREGLLKTQNIIKPTVKGRRCLPNIVLALETFMYVKHVLFKNPLHVEEEHAAGIDQIISVLHFIKYKRF